MPTVWNANLIVTSCMGTKCCEDSALMTGRRQAFQNNPELQRFVLSRVRPTDRQLGMGSYGSVEELEVNELVCAGKRLHEALLEQGNAGVADIARKYLSECQVTSRTAADIKVLLPLHCKKV